MTRPVPFVSVTVPVLNGERTIGDCLVSLLRMDYPRDRREIIVVDNGSTDRTTEIVKSFPVECVWEARRGLPYARNRGIEASKGDIIASTDADCVVAAHWLRELIGGFNDGGVGVVVGETVAYPPKTRAERYTAMRKPLFLARAIGHAHHPWFTFCNTAVLPEVFGEIGLLDLNFAGAGCADLDWSWRFFRSRSFTLCQRPKAVVFHRHRAAAGGLFLQYHGYGRGQAILRRKYPELQRWDWRREVAAWNDLVVTLLGVARTAVAPRRQKGAEAECWFQCLELVRKCGERIGFLSESLRGR